MANTNAQIIIPYIVSQHIEEAGFLWMQRDGAVAAPHYALKDLTKLDGRVEAHIDGLRIAGEPGWELVAEGLEQADAGGIFAAAVLAFEELDSEKMKFVFKTGIAAPELSRGLISALGWIPKDHAAKIIDGMLGAESVAKRRVAIAASAIHRMDPGDALRKALLDEDILLRARSAKAVGELGRHDLSPLLLDNLNLQDEACRFYAAWSGTLLGHGDALRTLQDFAMHGSTYSEKAVNTATRSISQQDAQNWQKELAVNTADLRPAILCAGAMGDPALIPWLIAKMENPDLARVAGEAFMLITGADIAYEDLEKDKPGGFEAGPTDNPEDEDVAMDPDEDLPWPDIKLVSQWWDKRKDQYRGDTRHLMGKPISSEHLQEVIRTGKQRQRAAAALELAMLRPGQVLFEVRARSDIQKKILGM